MDTAFEFLPRGGVLQTGLIGGDVAGFPLLVALDELGQGGQAQGEEGLAVAASVRGADGYDITVVDLLEYLGWWGGWVGGLCLYVKLLVLLN